jgi:hypothetical protein
LKDDIHEEAGTPLILPSFAEKITENVKLNSPDIAVQPCIVGK